MYKKARGFFSYTYTQVARPSLSLSALSCPAHQYSAPQATMQQPSTIFLLGQHVDELPENANALPTPTGWSMASFEAGVGEEKAMPFFWHLTVTTGRRLLQVDEAAVRNGKAGLQRLYAASQKEK